MNIPEVKSKHNLILYVSVTEQFALDKNGDKVSGYEELLKNIRITGIETILYCAKIKEELNVICMYYINGQSFMTESFVRKYVTGMRLKFVEPSVSGATEYFKSE
jgi:hypothetical protein